MCSYLTVASGAPYGGILKLFFVRQDDQFVAFRDIKPAAAHHYLIVTKRHIANAKVLSSSDKPLGGWPWHDVCISFSRATVCHTNVS